MLDQILHPQVFPFLNIDLFGHISHAIINVHIILKLGTDKAADVKILPFKDQDQYYRQGKALHPHQGGDHSDQAHADQEEIGPFPQEIQTGTDNQEKQGVEFQLELQDRLEQHVIRLRCQGKAAGETEDIAFKGVADGYVQKDNSHNIDHYRFGF